MMARIVFMGSPGFAVPSLRAIAARHDVAVVYCTPSRPRGRNMAMQKKPVHLAAETLDIAVETPQAMDDAVAADIKSYTPDFLVVVAYGMILPKRILDIPRRAAINAHASLLPRWRGAAPIQRAIAAGDKETGITTMLMEEKLDSGRTLKKSPIAIRDDDTAGTLETRLAALAADSLTQTIDAFDSITPEAQNETEVTWAGKITPGEAEIDFSQSCEVIERRIRAFAPKPGAWFVAGGKRIKVHEAKPVNADTDSKPGEVLKPQDGAPVISCGGDGGAIALMRLQPQGKAAMDGAAFLNGYDLPQRITKKG